MKRRTFFHSTMACAAAAWNAAGCGSSMGSELPLTEELRNALSRFTGLPGTPVYSMDIEPGPELSAWRMDYFADSKVMIGSAFKTFIVAACLQEIETGRLSYGQLVEINDDIRVNDSPVFINLAGSVQLRSLLDAITAYSDNMAADAVMKQVGAERVRAFLSAAGLSSTRIPDSVRIVESYLAGAPLGVDIGWDGIKALLQGVFPGAPRPAINDEVSIISTTKDLVAFYKGALRGDFFSRSSSIIEFKRLHAGGDVTFPPFPETLIYAKEGEASWLGFHVKCYAGQMILCGGTKVTFAFALNWQGPDADVEAIAKDFAGAITDALVALKKYFEGTPKA